MANGFGSETSDEVTSSEELFTQLYGRYRGELHAFCVRRIDRAEVEDVMAEVFAVVWRKIGSVTVGKERAWLYSIARNVIRNQWRGTSRRRRLENRVQGLPGDEPARPETIVIRRARDEALLRAVDRMPERDREILMLSAWDDLSGPEIAGVLGISVSSAQQRLHRAKKRLAKTLNRTQPSLVLEIAREEGTA